MAQNEKLDFISSVSSMDRAEYHEPAIPPRLLLWWREFVPPIQTFHRPNQLCDGLWNHHYDSAGKCFMC